MALENVFRVAIFDEFLDAFARIPKAQQKKVGRFLRKFREDPTSSSINYESIASFADPNLRTVRIDQAYRAIVLRPETGNVYVLLWVDHHDEAMRWAENKRISIHPETGAVQVVSAVESVSQPEPEPEPGAEAAGGALFREVRDRELFRLGVPEAYLPRVRQVRSFDGLEALRDDLPAEAFEALYWLAEGESLEEVERAMAVGPAPGVDTLDFATALERDVSRRRFALVEDDADLEAMLDAPLEKWRIFLHPSQRALVEREWNGPVRVLGGAGTGKCVVAMHRTAYLAERLFPGPNDRIFFTTFTRNLADDTRANLARLCSPEAMERIDVVHLDKWVADLLRSAGYPYQIRYWGSDRELRELWEKAMAIEDGTGFSPSFFRDEWELVVQAQGCETWEAYKKANRSGRGVRMSRGQRKAVWPVFEEYRLQLETRGLREPEDAMRDATSLLDREALRVNLRSIVVDEAQDMSTNAFRLLRAVLGPERPNDLFIVGNGHQRIYRKRVVLSHAGVNVRGRGRRLRINYRTTDEIRRHAVALLEGVDFDDLDAGTDEQRGYRSLTHGVEPEIRELSGFDEEIEAIVDWLFRGGNGGSDGHEGTREPRVCLAARTNDLANRYAEALEARGILTLRVKPNAADDPRARGLRVATMHRVKGLEFDRMIIAGLSEDQMPLAWLVARSEDPAVRREAELMERALLYVALTREREAVLVTAPGKLSRWVRGGG